MVGESGEFVIGKSQKAAKEEDVSPRHHQSLGRVVKTPVRQRLTNKIKRQIALVDSASNLASSSMLTN